MKQISIIAGMAALLCGVSFGQSETGNVVYFSNGSAAKIRADGMAGRFATAKLGLIGPTIKGAPYSADGVTETTQVLGDGTHISRQETYSIYRDGEGRIRRESNDQAWISDPVANVSYVLDKKQQTARKLSLSRTVAYTKMTSGSALAKLKAEAAISGPVVFQSGVMGARVTVDGVAGEPPKNESLGKQEMEGVEVDGSRITMVIPQGQIGNDRPIQSVHERWESAELHITMLSKHSDPMMGETSDRLTNVRRGEPDPALFQVPANFTIEVDK